MTTSPDKPRFQKIFLMLGGSVVGIFACAVILGILFFRTEVRKQVLQRDGVLLSSITQYLHEGYTTGEISDWELLELALESSEIRGIIAVRVFHPPGTLIAQVPDTLYPVALAEADRTVLASGEPVIRYFPGFRLDTLFSDIEQIDSDGAAPLVEVLTPVMHTGESTGAVIQYWLDGTGVATEFARIDRFLWILGAGLIVGGAVIFTIVFLYARHRLLEMARLLSERNRSLEQANAELVRAARTSAIGSVTSHLFHGLKNPLAGLKSYLKVTTGDAEAMAITDRMQSLIDETLGVIREQDSGIGADLSLEEFADLARTRLQDPEAGGRPRLGIRTEGSATIPVHKARLAMLILRNLVENALEADGGDQPVELSFNGKETRLEVSVRDHGPGLPEDVRERVFEPVRSSKSNGTGVGLAISSVLARHIPATLSLACSSREEGTCFTLQIPLE